MHTAGLESPIGTLEITGSAAGIRSIRFAEDFVTDSEDLPSTLRDCVTQLAEYFAGRRHAFTLKLDLQGTDFELRVWTELLNIPFGHTQTYRQIAARLGDPNAVRAVGRANGSNPVAIVVPCHRVLGSDGSLTGYAGGLARKEWLLAHEGRLIQQRLFP
jgi:methylated-DNA-[protein]-cysteine S-methyltransferase